MSNKLVVLVTGGLGFIGKSCVPKLLDAGCYVHIIDSVNNDVHPKNVNTDFVREQLGNQGEVHIGRIGQQECVLRNLDDIDVILHLAARVSVKASMSQPALYYDYNVMDTMRLCHYFSYKQKLPRIVLASSRAVYGEGAYKCLNNHYIKNNNSYYRLSDDLDKLQWDIHCSICGDPMEPQATSEDFLVIPCSVYGETKLIQEHLLSVATARYGSELIIFRFQNVCGAENIRKDVGIVNTFCRKILSGNTIHLFEDGVQSRDFIFVDDVADILVDSVTGKLSQNGNNRKVLNVGTGIRTSLLEIIQIIESITKIDAKYKVNSSYRMGDVRHICADVSRLREIIHWDPLPIGDVIRLILQKLRLQTGEFSG